MWPGTWQYIPHDTINKLWNPIANRSPDARITDPTEVKYKYRMSAITIFHIWRFLVLAVSIIRSTEKILSINNYEHYQQTKKWTLSTARIVFNQTQHSVKHNVGISDKKVRLNRSVAASRVFTIICHASMRRRSRASAKKQTVSC